MGCSTFIGGGEKKVKAEVVLKPDCKVLALQGKSSIGKTTTINKLIDYLLNKKGGKRPVCLWTNVDNSVEKSFFL